MDKECDFYICSTCFATSEIARECHHQMMIHCQTLQMEEAQLKPLLDADGDLITRAPRWFLEKAKLQKGFDHTLPHS